MTREIKFRGKRVDNGQWAYGQYFITPLTDENSGLPPEAGWFFLTGETKHCIARDGVSFVIDVKTLGQYTGLKANGKEIYEGDIVRICDRFDTQFNLGYCLGLVEWLQGSWNVSTVDSSLWDLSQNYFIEVIGNKFENPELLNG